MLRYVNYFRNDVGICILTVCLVIPRGSMASDLVKKLEVPKMIKKYWNMSPSLNSPF